MHFFKYSDELIRQITISQPERGLLLLRVRDELRMTLSAYQDLFVSSRDYDPYKNVLKESYAHQQEMETKLQGLNVVIKELQEERDAMLKILDNEDQTFKEKRETDNKHHSEEFHFLKRVNNVLKVKSKIFTISIEKLKFDFAEKYFKAKITYFYNYSNTWMRCRTHLIMLTHL